MSVCLNDKRKYFNQNRIARKMVYFRFFKHRTVFVKIITVQSTLTQLELSISQVNYRLRCQNSYNRGKLC